jgi:hypothetical protein
MSLDIQQAHLFMSQQVQPGRSSHSDSLFLGLELELRKDRVESPIADPIDKAHDRQISISHTRLPTKFRNQVTLRARRATTHVLTRIRGAQTTG